MPLVISLGAACGGSPQFSQNSIGPVEFEVLRDSTGDLTLEQIIQSSGFRPLQRTSFGMTSDVLWVKFRARIPDAVNQGFFLEIGYPLLDRIDFYFPQESGAFTHKQYGDQLPFHQRDVENHNFIIPLKQPAGQWTYYLRIQTAGSMSLPLRILSFEELLAEINLQKSFFGIFYGSLLIMLVYNLLLSMSLRERAYYWYVGVIVALAVVSLALNGYGFQYFWPTTFALNNAVPTTLFASAFITFQFLSAYVGLEKNSYLRTNKIVKVFLGLAAVGALTSWLVPYGLAIILAAVVWLMGGGLAVVGAVYLFRRGSREVRFLTLAAASFIIGLVITGLQRFGIVSSSIYFLWAFQIGSIISLALFSLGLSDRLNFLRNQYSELNKSLERKVEERTATISAAHEDLKKLNEKLVAADAIHKADLEMATVIQSTFMDEAAPQVNDFDIAFTYQPALSVSGDFYDFFYDGGQLSGAGLFDVSGHGVSAGLLTLIAKSIIFKTFNSNKQLPLDSILEKINQELIDEIGKVDNYLTGILLKMDGPVMQYVNCGHPDLLLKSAEDGQVRQLTDADGSSIAGMFLGIDVLQSQYKMVTTELQSGDSLLLYTDCLSECRSQGGVPFGDERIANALANSGPTVSAQHILATVLESFYGFIGRSNNLEDDLTIIVLKKK